MVADGLISNFSPLCVSSLSPSVMIRTLWKNLAVGAGFDDDDGDDDDDDADDEDDEDSDNDDNDDNDNDDDDNDDEWNLLEEGCCGSGWLSLKQDVDRAWNRVAQLQSH